MAQLESQLHEAAGSASAPGTPGADPEPKVETVTKEVTVYTRVQERAQWDMSQLVLDLDTKEAELKILQGLLYQKEEALQVGICRFFPVLDLGVALVLY